MMATARRLIDSRLRKSTDKRSDMLASFMRHGLTRDELFPESVLQILAGSDTTATALRATMLYLLTHPRIYMKLQKEVDAAVASGAVPPAPAIASDATLKNLVYLEAVIREGLRIHPPVTEILPKRVPKDGDTVMIEGNQIFLPGGTDIGCCFLGLSHSKKIFGVDADQFRPERWLLDEDNEANVHELATMKRTMELIFGYGKYQCLGKPVAWMEIGKVLFEFFRNFDWCLATPEKPWKEANCMGIFVHQDMWVHITERMPKQ